MLKELGIDVQKFYKDYDHKLYAGLEQGAFRQRNVWRRQACDRNGSDAVAGILAKTPLAPAVQKDIARLYNEKKDYLQGKRTAQKIALLRTISYAEFLTKHCGELRNPAILSKYSHDVCSGH